jgi:hypothetical protein
LGKTFAWPYGGSAADRSRDLEELTTFIASSYETAVGFSSNNSEMFCHKANTCNRFAKAATSLIMPRFVQNLGVEFTRLINETK